MTRSLMEEKVEHGTGTGTTTRRLAPDLPADCPPREAKMAAGQHTRGRRGRSVTLWHVRDQLCPPAPWDIMTLQMYARSRE